MSSVEPRSAGLADALPRREAPADHAWLLRLMEADGVGILRMLWRLLGSEHDVRDAYQDCLCKLADCAPGRPVRNLRAYAYRTAANIAIEFIRVRQRHAGHQESVGRTQAMHHADGDRTAGGDDQAERLRDAVARLPAHLRNVVILRDLSRMSYQEVSRTLGIDPGTARVYRRHAVVKLAELLGGGNV